MGTYVSTSAAFSTESGSYVTGSRHLGIRSAGYVSGTSDTAATGAYICSNLK